MKRNLVEPTGIKMLKEAFCVFDGGLGVYWSTVFPSQALRAQSQIFQEESRLLEMLVVRNYIERIYTHLSRRWSGHQKIPQTLHFELRPRLEV